MLAVALLVGLLIGLSLGALGGGGSILTVPALVYLVDQSPHAATTGSLLVVGITALTGTAVHWRAGRVRVTQGLILGLLGIAGSYLGTRLSASVDPQVLLTAFAALMLIAAAAMLRRSRTCCGDGSQVDHDDSTTPSKGATGPLPGGGRSPVAIGGGRRVAAAVLDRPATAATTCPLPSPTARFTTCRAIKVVAAATAVGLLTGFFGVGGGFVIVPVLVLVLGFDMSVAVGTSLLVIAINSATALAARLDSDAHLDLPLLALFTVTAIAGSMVGNRVAARVGAARLTVAFSVLLVAVALYTAGQSLPQLV